MSWAKGKAMNTPENGFPAQSAFARFMVNPGENADKAVYIAPLAPGEHDRVDAVITEMKYRKPHHFDIICLFYLERKRDQAIAKVLRESRSSIRSARECAEFWIDGRLGE